MEIRNLNTFITICKTGSFTKAAKKLGYAQSSVTSQIQILEKELDTKLFDRINKKIILTPEGEILLSAAKNIVNDSYNVTNMIKNKTPFSNIKLGIMESLAVIYLPEIMNSFYNQYPKANLEIIINSSENMIPMLLTGELDLVWTYREDILSKHITEIVVAKHPLCFITNNLNNNKLSTDTITNLKFIFAEENCIYKNILTSYLSQYSLDVNTFLTIDNMQLIVNMVSKGDYISFLPEFLTKDELATNKVIKKNLNAFSPNIDSALYYYKEKDINNGVKQLKELILNTKL